MQFLGITMRNKVQYLHLQAILTTQLLAGLFEAIFRDHLAN
jgi:hypothetical protein